VKHTSQRGASGGESRGSAARIISFSLPPFFPPPPLSLPRSRRTKKRSAAQLSAHPCCASVTMKNFHKTAWPPPSRPSHLPLPPSPLSPLFFFLSLILSVFSAAAAMVPLQTVRRRVGPLPSPSPPPLPSPHGIRIKGQLLRWKSAAESLDGAHSFALPSPLPPTFFFSPPLSPLERRDVAKNLFLTSLG